MSRRGENIYKRKDGRWEARYIKGKDLKGRVRYGYVYAKAYAEVKEKLNKIKAQSENNILLSGTAKTLFQVCAMWLNEAKTQIKHSTYVKYYNIIYNHIVPVIGSYKMHLIDSVLIRQFADEKLTDGKLEGGGLSPKTVKDILSVLRLVLNYANNNNITSNVNFNAISIKSNDTNIEVLSESRRTALSAYLISNMNNTNLGILICLYTGMRIGEICALRFEDISMIDKVVHIRKTMQRIQSFNTAESKTKVIITSPKSKSSVRDIPLPDFIADIIKENFNCPQGAYLLSGNDDYVEPRTLENRFKSVIKSCGIENVNFHILRHTFATHCVEGGVKQRA